jgi:post-segregation antitoxin (ccd killing protein)
MVEKRISEEVRRHMQERKLRILRERSKEWGAKQKLTQERKLRILRERSKEWGAKQKLTLTINNDTIDRAKEAGLNISELTEKVLDIFTYDLKKREQKVQENLVVAYESFFDSARFLLKKYGITVQVGKINENQNNTNLNSALLLNDNKGLLRTEGNDGTSKPIDVSKVLRFLFHPNVILENLLLEIMRCEQNNEEKMVELKFATRFLTVLSNKE